MRGDQLSRRWRIIRAIKASPSGLTMAEIAQREKTGARTIYRHLESLRPAGFPLYTDGVDRPKHGSFIDTFKIKIPSLLSNKHTRHAIRDYLSIMIRFLQHLGKAPLMPWHERTRDSGIGTVISALERKHSGRIKLTIEDATPFSSMKGMAR